MASVIDSRGARSSRLADALAALGSPTRLALLRELQRPKILAEIRVSPDEADFQSGRNISRQALKGHLEKLAEAGVIVARQVERHRGPTTEYVVNHQMLYVLGEELRSLARLRPDAELNSDTIQGSADAPAPNTSGTQLILVKGLDEGRAFPLGRDAKPVVIGRNPQCDIRLDFDPFVSSQNSVVRWQAEAHHLHDLPDSQNGTFLNFVQLPLGGSKPLRTGDLIGVGHCLLLYRA